MDIIFIRSERALSRTQIDLSNFVLNPYRGCSGGCAFCYSPAVLRMPREEWGRAVEARVNMPNVLAKELKKLKSKGGEKDRKGVVGVSTVTDPYQEAEKQLGITRFCLQQLLRYDMPVSIITINFKII